MTHTTRLLLIRHGATAANELRPYILQGGGINHSLSPIGQQQARSMARFLESTTIDAIYSSPLKRAVETAQSLTEGRSCPVQCIDELVEVDVGDWEGMTWQSILDRNPTEYEAFMSNPAANPYLGGESYQDVFNRSWPRILELLQRHANQTVAVVAHNVVNRVCLAEPLGIELSRAKQIHQSNTGINVLEYQDGETRLLTLNACFHLDGLEA